MYSFLANFGSILVYLLEFTRFIHHNYSALRDTVKWVKIEVNIATWPTFVYLGEFT